MPIISKPLKIHPKAVVNMSMMKSNMDYKFDLLSAKI